MDGLATLRVKKDEPPKNDGGYYAHQTETVPAQQQAQRTELEQCAMALELAADLRSGHMDSESRAQEVQRQVRLTLIDVAARLRTLSGL